MLSPKMLDLMNKQVNAELYSQYLYLGMAAWFESETLPGMASWMRVQAGEEQAHALKFFDQILARGAKVKLEGIQAPPESYASAEAAFEAAAAHEAKVTALINALADAALAEKDHATNAFLQYFITEQVEEEAAAKAIAHQLKMTGGSKGSLLMLDHKLGKRAQAGA
jgi:ferritin